MSYTEKELLELASFKSCLVEQMRKHRGVGPKVLETLSKSWDEVIENPIGNVKWKVVDRWPQNASGHLVRWAEKVLEQAKGFRLLIMKDSGGFGA